MRGSRIPTLFFILLAAGPFIPLAAAAETRAEENIQIGAAIQISSTVSDGRYTIDEIVKAAKENAIKVVVITDRDQMSWEYGIAPLEKIVRKRVVANSILKYGAQNYLDRIEEANQKYPSMIVIPGTESAPFYYWRGRPFSRWFSIVDWHKHILTIGLDRAKDYGRLPVIGNAKGLRKRVQARDIMHLWPLVLILGSILCFLRKEFDYRDEWGRSLGPQSIIWGSVGVFMIAFATLLLVNNFPYVSIAYDQYHGDRGPKPYQYFIDYAARRGALTFWAHPEAENIDRVAGVTVETGKHVEDLLLTHGYTGFAVFYDGYEQVGAPGGIWDQILNEYRDGRRDAPIWAIGATAYDAVGPIESAFRDIRTILLVRSFTKEEVMSAIREGRMYTLKGSGSSNFKLDEFTVADPDGTSVKTMGGELATSRSPHIRIRGHFLDGQSKPSQVKLIKNGRVIRIFHPQMAFDIVFDDPDGERGTRYYRLEVASQDFILVTNPVFVTIQ